MNYFHNILVVLKKHSRLFGAILSLIFVASFLSIVFPFSVKILFNEVVPEKKHYFVPVFFIIVTATFILKGICSYFQVKFSTVLANKVVTDIREDLFKKMLGASLHFIHGKDHSQISSLISYDLQMINDMVQIGVIQGVASLSMTIIFFLALCFINLQLLLISFVAVPLFAYFFLKLHKIIKEKSKRFRLSMGEFNSFVTESLNMLSTIRLYGLEDIFCSEQKKLNNRICSDLFSQKTKQGAFMSLVLLCFMFSFAVALALSARLTMTDKMTTGDMLAFYIILQGFYQPLMSFFMSFRSLQTGSAVLEKIDNFKTKLEKEKFKNVNFSSPPCYHLSVKKSLAIEVQNLHFSYNGNKILKGVNLEIAKGEKVLLLGLNGSGKSTLIKLFMGFFAPYEGDIFVYGKNLRQWPLKAVNMLFSVVEQDKHVFSGSLRINIDPEKKHSISEFKKYLKNFKLKDFYNQKTVVKKHGENLSGGEKQRVAILRAIVKDAPIFIFDEAFSNQDLATTNILQSFLRELPDNKTFVGITHDLSIAPFVDKIVLLDDGCIIESGTHKELIQQDSKYKDLYGLYTHQKRKMDK